MNEYALATLFDVKAELGIAQSDTANDNFLEAAIAACSAGAETYLHRKLRARSFVEYHDGGMPYLFVDNPPINSVSSIYDDVDRSFGSGTLISSSNYHFDGDFAKQGRIQLYKVEAFLTGTRNVKVTYNGGFDEFVVTAGENDYIDWYDEDEGALISTDLTAATYTGATLAAHIATAMTAESSGDTITCSYNAVTGKFTLTSNGNDHAYFKLAWATGTNTAKTAGRLLGFDVSADDASALSYTGDYATLGIPMDIQEAVRLWVARLYKDSFAKGGDGRLGISARNVGVTSTGTTYDVLRGMPDSTRALLAPYRRALV